MPLIQISELGSIGIIKDIPPYKLPANAWTDGENVRFIDTVVETTRGYKQVFGTPSVEPYWLLPWNTPTTFFWFYADGETIWRQTGLTHTEVTRLSDDYTGGSYPHWSGGVLGGVPVMIHNAMHADDPPQSWNGASNFQDLPNWPNETSSPTPSDPWWRCKVIRVFKQYLVALYMSENVGSGAVEYPTRLRWSNPADPGTVPTEWLPTYTNLAGDKTFAETTDALVDCLPLRDVNIVYKENTTHIMQAVPSLEVFGFRQAFTEFGLLTDRCVKSFFGNHFVVAKGDILVHNGQSAKSVVDKQYKKFIFDNIDQDNWYNSFVVPNPLMHEMWVCVPSSGNTRCDLAHIWHWDDNTWTTIDLPNILHIGVGIVDEDQVSQIIDSRTGIIDSYTDFIDRRAFNPVIQAMLGGSGDGVSDFHLLRMDDTYKFGGNEITATITRTGLALHPATVPGGYVVNTQSIKYFRRHWPTMEVDANVTVTIKYGTQETIDGDVTWVRTATFDPETENWVDVNMQGKILAIQYTFTGDGRAKLISHGMDIDVVGQT